MPAVETDIMKNYHYGNPITSPRKKVRHFKLKKKKSLCQFWTIISYQCHRAVPRSKVKKKLNTSITFFVCLGLKKNWRLYKISSFPAACLRCTQKKYIFFTKVLFLPETRAKFFLTNFFFL